MNFYQANFMRHEWIFEDRLLKDNATDASDNTPTGSSNEVSPEDVDSLLEEDNGIMRFGIIFLAAFAVILLFVGWRSFKYWKLRRERYMMQVQSNRADAVLGDMQVCGW